MSDTYLVRTNDPSNTRTLFAGPQEAAEEYVINNFPRLHAAFGGADPRPDVVIGTEDQTVNEGHYWNGEDWIEIGKKSSHKSKKGDDE